VIARDSFLAFSRMSAPRYAGWKGVVMRISVCCVSRASRAALASGSSFWKTLSGPSLSSVTMSLAEVGYTSTVLEDSLVTLLLEPVAQAKLVLYRAEQTRLFLCGYVLS
jgi:hypothetical protein